MHCHDDDGVVLPTLQIVEGTYGFCVVAGSAVPTVALCPHCIDGGTLVSHDLP